MGKDMEEQIKTLENRLTSMVLENNGYLKRIKALERENEYLSIRLSSISQSRALAEAAPGNKAHQNEIQRYSSSYSFRVGEIIVNGLARPGKNTLMMPFRLIGLAWEIFKVKRF